MKRPFDTQEETTPQIIGADQAGTLPGLFRRRVALTPDREAYRQFDSSLDTWRAYSWRKVSELVARWRGALAREDLRLGDRVAIRLRNSVEWVCLDQAALSLGLVVVPLYTNDTPGAIAYILCHCQARVLVVGTRADWELLAPHRERFTELRRVVYVEPDPHAPPEPDPVAAPLQAWLDSGTPLEVGREVAPEDLATIVYTSGTTGTTKGVMQSHRNILWNAQAVVKMIPCRADDLFLSFLPLSHSFERTVGYYLPMMAGACVAYARSIRDLGEDLLTVRPTVLLSVPRVFERVYVALQRQLIERGTAAQRLFQWAQELGWQRFEFLQGRGPKPKLGHRLAWAVLRRIVADKVLRRLGGRIRVAVSGGASLNPRIGRCFISLGLPVIQGYGLTEASPVVAGNRLEDNVPESVGAPLPGVEVRLGADGELLVRAPSVMLGYWRSDEGTARSIDQDGWLHTGDRAEIVDGRIYLMGRTQDTLVLSTGEKVSPGAVELRITQDPLVEQAMVVGHGMPYVGALLVLNRGTWSALAQTLTLDPHDPRSLRADEVKRTMTEMLRRLLEDLPSHAQVRRVCLFLEPWTTDEGLLTPTMKLKRGVIEQRFEAEIRGLYKGHDVDFRA